MAPETGGAMTRCRVIYHGRVQGVCFRATAFELSRRNKVVGYVRNCRDGTVELEAEGRLDEVEAFLTAVAREFEGYIASAERTRPPPRGDEKRFEIRY